jgi:hypothetical protein
VGLVPEPHHVGEGHNLNELMALILNLDERSCVQVTSEKVARHDAAKAIDGLTAGSRVVCDFDPFLVLGELSAVTEVEVEDGHESRIHLSWRLHINMARDADCPQWVESGHEIKGEIIPASALFAVSRLCYEPIITGQTVGSGG